MQSDHETKEDTYHKRLSASKTPLLRRILQFMIQSLVYRPINSPRITDTCAASRQNSSTRTSCARATHYRSAIHPRDCILTKPEFLPQEHGVRHLHSQVLSAEIVLVSKLNTNIDSDTETKYHPLGALLGKSDSRNASKYLEDENPKQMWAPNNIKRRHNRLRP